MGDGYCFPGAAWGRMMGGGERYQSRQLGHSIASSVMEREHSGALVTNFTEGTSENFTEL